MSGPTTHMKLTPWRSTPGEQVEAHDVTARVVQFRRERRS